MIKDGDFVIIYFSEKLYYTVLVKKSKKFSSHKGEIFFDDIIGKEVGEKGKTHLGHEFFLLSPTFYDLQLSVKRKTNIVYPKDAGFIIMKSFIKPGARVIEAGTGSGSLTLLMASLVAPNGKVFSYDYREDLQKIGISNVEAAGVKDQVEFFIRDVTLEGFLQKNVDTVVLDLPEPWKVVNFARDSLRGGGSLVALSPNMEQVKKTFTAMDVAGFVRIETYELMLRPLLVRKEGTRPVQRYITHTLYLLFGYKIIK